MTEDEKKDRAVKALVREIMLAAEKTEGVVFEESDYRLLLQATRAMMTMTKEQAEEFLQEIQPEKKTK